MRGGERMITRIFNAVHQAVSDFKIIPKAIYFYAHNAGNFDLKVMLKDIYTIHKDNSTTQPSQISDPDHKIYQTSIVYRDLNFVFRDSYIILTSSVKDLNEGMLGGLVGKMSMNLELLDTYISKGFQFINTVSVEDVKALAEKDTRYGVVEG